MGKVIAVANQKGGIGKTTTAVALATYLHEMGYNTLLIDTDPQQNSTDTYRAEVLETATLYDLLFDNVEGETVKECIQHMKFGDIIPSDKLLVNSDSKFPNDGSRLFLLKERCEAIVPKYDFIILDTPPNLGCMLSNVLTFAQELIIPVTCDRYGMQGMDELFNTVYAAQKYTNRELKVAGILLVKYHANTTLCREISEKLPGIAEMFQTKVFETRIRESEACKKSQSNRKPLCCYAPKATTAIDYYNFCKELIREIITDSDAV